MKRLLTALCFMLATTPLAFAQDKAKDADKKAPAATEKSAKGDESKASKEPSEKQKAQQARMRDCSEKAGDRKGDERKKYMSSCLKGEDPTKAEQPAKTAQQEKTGDLQQRGEGQGDEGRRPQEIHEGVSVQVAGFLPVTRAARGAHSCRALIAEPSRQRTDLLRLTGAPDRGHV